MRGNVYISIPAADKDNALPSAITRYDWTESLTMKKVKLKQRQPFIQRGRSTAKSTKRILVRPYRLA